jgi:hypothetical protein
MPPVASGRPLLAPVCDTPTAAATTKLAIRPTISTRAAALNDFAPFFEDSQFTPYVYQAIAFDEPTRPVRPNQISAAQLRHRSLFRVRAQQMK